MKDVWQLCSSGTTELSTIRLTFMWKRHRNFSGSGSNTLKQILTGQKNPPKPHHLQVHLHVKWFPSCLLQSKHAEVHACLFKLSTAKMFHYSHLSSCSFQCLIITRKCASTYEHCHEYKNKEHTTGIHSLSSVDGRSMGKETERKEGEKEANSRAHQPMNEKKHKK